MGEDSGMTRRTVIGAGAAALATVAASDLFSISNAFAATGPTNGVGYFARFGVTEKLLRDMFHFGLISFLNQSYLNLQSAAYSDRSEVKN